MQTKTIEEHSLLILRWPLVASLCAAVFLMLMVDFNPDTVHIVIGVLTMGLAIFSGYQLSAFLARRLSEHVGSSFVLLRMQIDSVLAADRDFAFHSDVAEAMALADSSRKLHDRTEEVRQEMRGLEQVRSQFLANVSHELRTPIFALQGYLETLLDGAEHDDNVRHTFLEKAHTNAMRLNVLLGDLIDISRIESGEMRMSFRYFNIVDVARETCQTLEGLARQYTVSLFVDSPSDEMLCLGDKERIIQVLSNLVSNSIRYNRPAGSVTIELRKNEVDDVEVAVRDNGMGISEEHQRRIFERFYRADTNRSRSTGGSGLGLAIVKHILEAHDSEPEVQSKENVGTTIRFHLRG